MLLLEWLRNAAQPPGSTDLRDNVVDEPLRDPSAHLKARSVVHLLRHVWKDPRSPMIPSIFDRRVKKRHTISYEVINC